MTKSSQASHDQLEAVLARMAAGDRAAVSALYAATSARLFGIALRVLGNRAEAEDALQEVYVKVWFNAGRYRPGELSPMTWLITVARNHAVDRHRKGQRRRSSDHDPIDEAVDLADPSPSPEEAVLASSLRGAVRDCLGQLKPPRGEAVVRAYVYGDSYVELAARYHVPLNTIRTWLRRSLVELRACLDPDEAGPR